MIMPQPMRSSCVFSAGCRTHMLATSPVPASQTFVGDGLHTLHSRTSDYDGRRKKKNKHDVSRALDGDGGHDP